ncbi:MAG: IPT/TIG domain-containing protein [Planctomycetota bacterium]
MTPNVDRRVALCALVSCLLCSLPLSGQGTNTVAVLQTGLTRVDFLDGNGAVSGFATLAGVPLVGARAADGSLWVGTDLPTRLVNVSAAGAVSIDVPLPGTPSGIAIDATGNIWVSLIDLDQLRVHNPAGSFINTFGVGNGPRGVSISASGAVWVANSLAGSVSRVTSGLVFTFPTGGTPFDVAVRATGEVWVSNLIGNSVQLLSAAGAVTDTVAVGLSPQGLALDEQDRLWVAATGSSTVYLIPQANSTPTIFSVGANPRGVAVDGRGRAWVACQGDNTVHRIDPRTGSSTSYPGFSQVAIAGDSSGLARARIVDPNGDVDADTISNSAELAVLCNPFDSTLPEIGRVTPTQGSIEGGSTLSVEGCGFLQVTTPQLFLGTNNVTPITVVDDFLITGPVPPGSVTATALETRLADAGVNQDILPASFLYTANPGQAWLPANGGADWFRVPIASDGTRGATTTVSPSFVAAGIAVDALGAAWFVAAAGGGVERRTADGVVTDTWNLAGTTLGGIAIAVDGSAWVVDSGTVGTPGNQIHQLVPGNPVPAASLTVGTRPVTIAVAGNGEVWVGNRDSGTVSRVRNGSLVTNFAVGAQPFGIAVDRLGRAWVATQGDGMLHEVDSDSGVLNSIAVGSQPAGVAVAGNDSIWVTLEGSAEVARVDPTTGAVAATYATATAPRAIAIDGGDVIWVLHAGSGDVRRFAVNGVPVDSFATGTGGVVPGDFIGVIPVFFHHPSDDHDGDGVCSGAEIQQGGEPFHADVVPTTTLYFEGITPNTGFMVGGTAITISGCALDSGNLSVLIGGNPVADLVILDGSTATGTIPASTNLGTADVVVSANAGSVIAPGAFTYTTSPISNLNCVQDGVPITISWDEDQSYDDILITREGAPLVTLPAGLGAFADVNAPIGLINYSVTPVLNGEAGPAEFCFVTVTLAAPTGLTCQQQDDSLVLSWSNTTAYDNIVVERDGFALTTLPGMSESYADVLPAVGSHSYEVYAVSGAFESTRLVCNLSFEVLPPTALTCDGDFGMVTLGWSSSQPYGFVRIFRDATLVIELAGDPLTFVDATADEGPHDYDVVGVLQGTASVETSCSATVPVPAVTNVACSSVVFDVTATWQLGLLDYDQVRVLRDGNEVALLGGSITQYDDIGVPLGTYQYDIVAVKNGTEAAAGSCMVTVTGPVFIRGDVNADSNVDIGDPVAILSYLFSAGTEPQCLDAADVNDDGTVNVADAVYDLTYLFSMGAPPPPPFPGSGPDPTGDTISCLTSL